MNKLNFKPGTGELVEEEKVNFSPRAAARSAAVQALYQWHINYSDVSDIISQFVEEGRLYDADLTLFKDLVQQVSQQFEGLDDIYGAYLDRKVAMIDPIEKNIMRIAVYELKNTLNIPSKVIINEAVELAKRFGAEDSHKYVNGILDKVAKNLRAFEFETPAQNA